MTVKDILILSSDIIDRKDISDYLKHGSSETSIDASLDAQTLLKCYNLIVSQIISEYYRLNTVEKFTTTNGVFEYKDLSKNAIAIISVKDENFVKVDAQIYPTKLFTKLEKGYIEYEYVPNEQEENDEFIFQNTPITGRIVALGVASEYLFIKGCFAESDNYGRKFSNSILSAITKKGKIILPARKWF